MSDRTDCVGRRPPLALWAHVAFVAGATAVLVRDPGGGGAWLVLIAMALIEWQLLSGSLFAWWVEVVGVAASIAGFFEARQRVAGAEVDLSFFLSGWRSDAAAILLLGAGVTLFLPAARSYARRVANFELTPLGTVMFAFAVLLVAGVPAEVLSAERHLPSRGMVENAAGATLIGGSERRVVAFYVKETARDVCLIHVEPNASGSTCDDLISHRPPNIGTDGDVFSGIVDKEVTRVEIRDAGDRSYEATLVDDPSFSANFFYLVEGPDYSGSAVFVGYDAEGDEVFHRTL